jgi:hypothetical protein
MAHDAVSVNAATKRECFEYDVCPGPNQIAGTATNVGYPHYTTTTVTDSAEVGPDTAFVTAWMYPFSVQYAEGSTYQDTYAINNGQILSPLFITAETGTVNTTTSEEHYSEATTATTSTYTQLTNFSAQGVNEGQLLAEESDTYITQQDAGPDMTHSFIAEQSDNLQAVTADVGGVFAGCTSPDPSSLCSVARINSSHTAPTLKLTDEWLKRNYEVAKDETLLHSTLQSHYHRHCKENNLRPVSVAILGRRVRKVFPAVEKRRLGKRGDSKYHYCGIRAIPESAIYQLTAVCSRPSSQLLYKLPSDSGDRCAIQKTEKQYDQNMNQSPSFNESNSSSQHRYHHQESQNDDPVTLKKRAEGRASFRLYRKCQFQFSYPE